MDSVGKGKLYLGGQDNNVPGNAVFTAGKRWEFGGRALVWVRFLTTPSGMPLQRLGFWVACGRTWKHHCHRKYLHIS